MSFDVRKHFLVPKHMIVPKEKVSELLKKLGTSREKLPQILKNDPAIKALKAERNDIVKIVRDSPTAGKSIYYRRVV